MSAPPAVVVGGTGFFGKLVVDELGGSPSVGVLSRSGGCDQHDEDELRRRLAGARVVVHAAGPYQGLAPTVAKVAVELGLHYVDLADDAAFLARVGELHESAVGAGVALLPGMSTVPGLARIFARRLRPHVPGAERTRVAFAPGLRGQRGEATFRSAISVAGRPLTVTGGGRHGWSEPLWVPFPEPVGPRLTYVAAEVGEDLEVRAGAELAWIGRFLARLARVRARFGRPRLEAWTPLFRALCRPLSLFGSTKGAVLVEVSGPESARALAVVSAQGGERLPAAPAAIAARALLSGEVHGAGLLPAEGWMNPDRFLLELKRRGFAIFERPGADPWDAWEPA